MSSVSINLKTDEVVIKIDDNATQTEIIEELNYFKNKKMLTCNKHLFVYF